MGTLRAADSFRVSVRGSRVGVRGLERHIARFTHTVRAATEKLPPRTDDFEAFLSSALSAIVDFGEGFPRLECDASGTFAVRLRPLPTLSSTIELRSYALTSLTEPLGDAAAKGPNIERYAQIATKLGGEAALVAPDGHILEGTTTSFLWWSGAELRYVEDQNRIPSITEAIVLEGARAAGVRVRPANITASGLTRHEVWAVNALHGIRTVTSIDRVEMPVADHERLTHFRHALERSWEPLSETGSPKLD